MSIKVVGAGVDTLIVNVRYADATHAPLQKALDEDIQRQLDLWQEQAQQAEEAIASPWSFHQARLFIAPHGAGKGQWRWLLTSEQMTLCLSRGRFNGIIAQVRLSSDYLWAQPSLPDAIAQIHSFLLAFFRRAIHLQLSELHLCADVVGWDVSSSGGEASFVRRPGISLGCWARKGHAQQIVGADFALLRGRQLATVEFGMHNSPLSCSIYNKTLEIRQRSKKTWFYDLWKKHGWNGTDDVWRVEFRYKREFLHEVGIETANDILHKLPELWAYSTGHLNGGSDGLPDGWLRYVTPSLDHNRSRWRVEEAWQAVQQAFSSSTAVWGIGPLVRERKREVNIKRGVEATVGYLSTLAAWLGGKYASQDTDLSVVLGWLYTEGNWYLEQKVCAFQDIVQRKRERYGLPALA